ncbi:MAG: aminopeptidase [Firmicutes bacterium]|nr:aminopeptidase [Bacillota bacterium]
MENELLKLSNTIVNYSVKVKEGERVLIITNGIESKFLIKALIRDIVKVKGIPFVRIVDNEINALLMELTNSKRIDELAKHKKEEVDNFDVFISIRYTENEYEGKHINTSIRKEIGEKTSKSDDIRINKRKWVLLNYPSLIDAYKIGMPYDEYKNYAIKSMNFDYSSMEQDIKPLKELMQKTNKVRIVSPNTDISFSIKNMNIVPCCGTSNIPDGEIYTAPVKNSVNGKITYNTPSPYQGNVYRNVSLIFKDGKIIKATCDGDNEALNAIFDTDSGSRYVGEFSLGLNPMITKPMGDILYDEKIIGSIHFTPGKCYDDADNGNDSSIHWDMVLIQNKEFGGGEIYFDDVLIRKDGKFVLEDLKHLNYNLK